MRNAWIRTRSGLAGALLAAALGVVPSGRAATQLSFDDLVANLKSPNVGTRLDAVTALGKSRRREAVAPLAALVRDPDPRVRLEVVKALGDLRDLSAIPALVTLVADEDVKVREESLGTVVEIYCDRERDSATSRFLDLFSDEFDRASCSPIAPVDPSVYGAMAAALRDGDEGIRKEAALGLGILDGKSALPELAQALQDPAPDVRGAAATAIGKVGAPDDGKQLIPLLADESSSVRSRAIRAIGVLRVREAGPALRAVYEANPRREIGMKALACLSRVADPAQEDLLRDLLQDPDPEKRRLAVEGLARISDSSMLTGLKKDFQRERRDDMRLAYAFALTRLGDRAFVDSLVLCLSSGLATRCRDYLLELGPDLLPDLYPYLADPDADVRTSLCDILGELGDPASIGPLTPLLADASSKVADHATRAVERLKRAGEAAGQR